MIDYRALLFKYMKRVEEIAAFTCLYNFGEERRRKAGVTDEEWEDLQRMGREVDAMAAGETSDTYEAPELSTKTGADALRIATPIAPDAEDMDPPAVRVALLVEIKLRSCVGEAVFDVFLRDAAHREISRGTTSLAVGGAVVMPLEVGIAGVVPKGGEDVDSIREQTKQWIIASLLQLADRHEQPCDHQTLEQGRHVASSIRAYVNANMSEGFYLRSIAEPAFKNRVVPKV